jgi:hypothetical protein
LSGCVSGIEREDRRDARNRREGPDIPDRELLSKNGNFSLSRSTVKYKMVLR